MPEDEGWQEISPIPEDDEGFEDAWVDSEPTQEPVVVDDEDTGAEDLNFYESFDPKWRNKFEGLTYLGHLEAEVTIPYHSFTVRTLKTGEKIKVTELIQHLEASITYARAYRAAVVAAGLMLVDGKPLLVGSRKIDAIAQKYQYIVDNWYDYVIDILYDKINELEGQALEVLKELGVYLPRREVAQSEQSEVTGPLDE